MSDTDEPRITVTPDGPYIVRGGVRITRQFIETDADGESASWLEGEPLPKKQSCGLCRCGQSGNKPYCDGSHLDVGFDGTETAENIPYSVAAERIEGPDLTLLDDKQLCADARFCHRSGGAWNRVLEGGEEADSIVVEEAELCPSGRYTAAERDGSSVHEPEFDPPSIGVVHDPHAGCAGPLWVRGGIPVEGAEGTEYEVRNRVTLCRCGKSGNKPFCDGSHVTTEFQDPGHNPL